MLTRCLHSVIAESAILSQRRFHSGLKNCQQIQSRKLKDIIKKTAAYPWVKAQGISADNFTQRVPLSRYDQYADYFLPEKQLDLKERFKISRFEPTSGSTFKRKWIPYTAPFLSEINQAASVWMRDLYEIYPGIRKGPHYWSLSWLPEELRKNHFVDDRELFPFWKRFLMQKVFVNHPGLAFVGSEAAWRFATCTYLLASPDLSMISVWSPTFLLSLLDFIKWERTEIEKTLAQKKWTKFADELKNLPVPKATSAQQDFAQLKLISCWMSGNSKQFAEDLRKRLPQAEFQGKGLWATEGVVTIPYQGLYPLAVTSHFYEFLDLHSQKVLQAYELGKDQWVSPILTTGSGLWRYCLDDQMLVTGHLGNVPCLEFHGRIGTSDTVGEKLSFETIREVLKILRDRFSDVTIYGLYVKMKDKPEYGILALNSEAADGKSLELTKACENLLLQNHHYQVARQLSQIAPCNLKLLSGVEEWLKIRSENEIVGQGKVEDLIRIS